MALTKEEVLKVQEHLVSTFADRGFIFGLAAPKPGIFQIVLISPSGVKKQAIDAIEDAMHTYLSEHFAKELQKDDFIIRNVGEIEQH